MTNWKTRFAIGAMGALMLAAPALAQDAAPAVEATVNKGDTAWMLVSTALVLMMSIPGLALFYGGLVRTKNMLSVLTQVFMIVSVVALLWVSYGYSLAFTGGGGDFFGTFAKAGLIGVDATSVVATFSEKVMIPEYVYIAFQMTFACITVALIVGAFAERIKFSSLMIFAVIWATVVYFPVAHMVWYWDGPDAFVAAAKQGEAAYAAALANAGLLFQWGALDFAGGTVVHINAGIAGLVGCLIVGKRIGYGKEAMPPHSLVMTMIGASLLWVGWFGFNAGSNLEANGVTGVAFLNTFVATAAAAVSWVIVEQLAKGKPSLLGGVTGAVAGLVAITPASGFAGPMGAIVLGLIVSPICFFFCSTIKNKLGYDDSLDVFGVHGIGGIVGALATGILVDPALGGQGIADYLAQPGTIQFTYPGAATQLMVQLKAVLFVVAWSGIGSALIFYALKLTLGLRPTVDAEREGLDVTEHGERAYNY
ncbi:ammonium transporter [Sandaracinobacteroides saxicola]|uniref:Ammonium transporter n=1 Tax=Sandaracinobacteroides saxicola TaxID=2759707 RepID=A0A7G5IJG0_9SPHN|nr:ammonium transporter [Sandaracinobacteroides saxicola]QMW23502.1 ammonium transporter [Sandaracinobacteroides saxicola]